MTEIHNPHDRFFKEVFSHPEAAAEFFAAFLPSHLVALLDLAKLEPIKDSFIARLCTFFRGEPSLPIPPMAIGG
ncbi:MAG: Rpn family recombination-promoting nuclease/putative transposase [Acidobacteria bacterium]|nr:Rpn family recombination-promoting nuclease/putative transposase [Acidobacteriota bacterium]